MNEDCHPREDDDRDEALVAIRGELRRLWHEERHADARRRLERATDDLGSLPILDVMTVRQVLRDFYGDSDRENIDAALRDQLSARLEGAADAAEGRPDVIVESAVAAFEIEDRRLAGRLIARLPNGVAATIDPDLVGPLLYVSGELLADRRQYARAEEQFRAAIDLDPTSPNAYAGLAAVLTRRGNLQGAEEVIARGLAQAAGDEHLRTLADELAGVPGDVRAGLRARSSPEVPGTDDRCWCGSGRAVADCHGRT